MTLGVSAILVLAGFFSAGPTASLPSAGPGSQTQPASQDAPARGRIGLPDADRTPGAINPDVTVDNLDATICKPGWARTVRPSAAYTGPLKVYQIFQYRYADRDPLHYQEDHLVPLELGGAPKDPKNLWPQPNEVSLPDGTALGADEKDDLEDELHARVCAGTMALADAQRMMATDWIAAWEAAGRP